MAFRDRFGGCPDCGLPLIEVAFQDATGRRCSGCGGTWLASDAVSRLVSRDGMAPPIPIDSSDQLSHRRCPVCAAQTCVAYISVVTIELCEGHGVWFDRGELERVAGLADEPPWVRTLLAARKALRQLGHDD